MKEKVNLKKMSFFKNCQSQSYRFIQLWFCGESGLLHSELNQIKSAHQIRFQNHVTTPCHTCIFVCLLLFFFVIVFVFGIVYLIFWVGSQCAVEKLVVFTRDRLRVNYIRLLENGSTADRLNDGFISQQGFFTGKWWGKWEDE